MLADEKMESWDGVHVSIEEQCETANSSAVTVGPASSRGCLECR